MRRSIVRLTGSQLIKEIMDRGVMMTPALVVDGEVKVTGKVPPLEDIKKMIK